MSCAHAAQWIYVLALVTQRVTGGSQAGPVSQLACLQRAGSLVAS